MADNVNLQTGIFEDQLFQREFANNLRDVGFNENNHDLKRIWVVVFRAINKSVSTARNENLQIDNDIVPLLQNLRIKSERIFEYENIRAELANVGLDVGNRNLRGIWRKLVGAVNNSVRAIRKADLRCDIVTLLRKLRIAQITITENDNFRNEIADDLAGIGFDVRNDNPEQISHWKVLRLAVDHSVCADRNINLANENIEYTKLRLEQLLLARRTPNRNIGNSLDDVFYRQLTQELACQLRRPQDIANRNFLGIKRDTHVDFVTNLIEKQFLIKWNTNVSGEPKEFKFYTFCDVEKLKENEQQDPQNVPMEVKTKHLQYEPRRAHVMVQLYRFCRTRPRIEYTKYQLCPPVYIRNRRNWTKWDPVTDNFTPVEHSHFNRMSKLIRKYISSHAIRIDLDPNHPQVPEIYTLYWAVVQDRDFRWGDHLKLKGIGNTQVYVGKANKGIKGRWITAGSSHCTMMKRCLDNVQAMTTYDPCDLKEFSWLTPGFCWRN